MTRYKDALRSLERAHTQAVKERQAQEQYEREHPKIISLTPEEADAQRQFEHIGAHCVTCDIRCVGKNIPSEYSHTDVFGDVRTLGIDIDGWDSYYVFSCDLFGRARDEIRACATNDPKLQEAARKSANHS